MRKQRCSVVKVAQAGGRCCSILGQRSNAYGLVALVWFLPFLLRINTIIRKIYQLLMI